ncbi:MAG TPA: sialate O-acetylesterase [Gemmataceae bacterium]|nr:sialate O-acetylesterase [Gemmataceae bacterium]
MIPKPVPRLLLAALAATFVPAVRADVVPNSMFTDHAVLQRDKPIAVWGTADPGESIRVGLSTEPGTAARTEASNDGKWMVNLPSVPAGGPFTLTIQGKNRVQFKDVLVGEVWICSGQSNMEWVLRNSYEPAKDIETATNPKIRLFTVAKATSMGPMDKVHGEWKECSPETVPGFSAVGYYFGRDLQKALDVPVGLIHTSWGGTPAQAWTSKEGLDAVPELRHYQEELAKRIEKYDPQKEKEKYEAALEKYKEAAAKAKEEDKRPPQAPRRPQSPEKSPNSASVLFNAMIAPIVPYGIRGAIWYQGESNAAQAYEYRTLFPTMIEDWRAHWKQGDFPFLCVQLAPYRKIEQKPTESDWAELREAQLMATKKLSKVGMAVITDVGEENDIHPKKKEPVGARLALLALKIAYGKDIVAMGPVFKKMTVEGNRAVLSFDNVGAGLECHGQKLTGVTVAGPDRKFHNAEAEIRGDTVVVSSPDVERPVAVRFGWANYPVVNLWNKNGLPATPFRTDNWPGVTQKEQAAAK